MSDLALTRYDSMRQALVEAHSVDDVREMMNQAEALRHYAKQVGESLENQNMFAEIKLRAQRRLGELRKEMEKPIRVAINLTMSRSGNANDAVTAVFKRGEYTCTSLEFAEEVAAATFDFSKWFKRYNQQAFIFAISRCLRNPNYDHKRMMQKMEYLSTRLVRCSRMEEYLEKLEEIYNHKVQTENRVWLTKQ